MFANRRSRLVMLSDITKWRVLLKDLALKVWKAQVRTELGIKII